MQLALIAARLGNLNAISDAASAVTLAKAAFICAAYNVRINIASLQNTSIAQPLLDELKVLDQQTVECEAELKKVLKERAASMLAS
jgi:glutamate formiminotransferase/formiminotetrahydrofolate cyclodeaminase